MEYIHGLDFQTRLFFQSVGFGFLLGILYDVFRFVRILISEKRAFIIFMDMLYFTLCGFLIFCFALVLDNGEIRAYLLVGNLAGWLICYFSMGIASAKIRNLIRSQKRNIRAVKLKIRKKMVNSRKKS